MRRRRDGRHQHFRRGADDAVAVVVLGHPVAVVAERVAMPRERERLADRLVLPAAARRGGLVEDGKLRACSRDDARAERNARPSCARVAPRKSPGGGGEAGDGHDACPAGRSARASTRATWTACARRRRACRRRSGAGSSCRRRRSACPARPRARRAAATARPSACETS